MTCSWVEMNPEVQQEEVLGWISDVCPGQEKGRRQPMCYVSPSLGPHGLSVYFLL